MEKTLQQFILYITCTVSFVLATDLSYTINEEPDIGAKIGNIANESGLYQILNDSERNSMKYTILDSTYASYFNINERTSDLYVHLRLDRESLQACEFSTSCDLTIDIVAQSTVGTFFKKIKVKITITDINDHIPEFPENSTSFELSEAFVVGSSRPISGAVDSDSGNYSVQRYYLKQELTPFTVQYDKFVDGSSSVRLVVSKKLDREEVDFYQLTVVAEDGGQPKLTGTLNLNVTITDVNDNSPSFNQSKYYVSVKEDKPVGSVIYKIKATDPDLGDNGMVIYRLSPHQSDSIKQMFAVDNITGDVRISQTLVYTPGEPYKVIVEANDGASIPSTSQATIFVTVLDSSNNAPIINVNLLSNTNVAKISENASVGAAVAHIAVSDDDTDQNGNVTCSIHHDVFKLDLIAKNEYKVVVSQSLDRETTDKYKVVIKCVDAGTPPKNSSAEFEVKVLDENDHRPTFLKSRYDIRLNENNFIGAHITKVAAIDLDIGTNAEITYSIESSLYDFQVEPDSGDIFANFILDRENLTFMEFRVLAVDKGQMPLTGTAVVSVTLLDINDNAPTFTKSGVYVMYAKENEPAGYYVDEVIAEDGDAGSNGQINFASDPEIMNEIPFKVLSDGSIFSTASLDRESRPHGYNFNVVAYDHGKPSLNSTAHVTIFILDENDNDPVITFPMQDNSTVQIVYERPTNSVIAYIRASDNDTGINAQLTYSILQMDMLATFRINPHTGEINLASPLSSKDMRSYTFTIQVEDGGSPKRKDRQNLTVIISSNAVVTTQPRIQEKDNALIVIVIVCVTIILSGAIIMIIFLIRRMDRKKKERKKKNAGELKNDENDMYDSINKNGTGPKVDIDRIEKRVSFSNYSGPTGQGDNGHTKLPNGHLADLQLPNDYLAEDEDVTQIVNRMSAPPSRNPGGRSVYSGRSKNNPNKQQQTRQMAKLQLHQSNLQSWSNPNGLVFVRKNEDNHSETSGETNDSGRGGSESDIHSSGCNHSAELDYIKNRYSPINSPGRPLLTQENITKFQHPKERCKPYSQYLVQHNIKKHNSGTHGLPYLHKPSSVHWNSISDVLNGSMATIDDYDDDTTTSGSYVVDEQDLDFECSLSQDCVV